MLHNHGIAAQVGSALSSPHSPLDECLTNHFLPRPLLSVLSQRKWCEGKDNIFIALAQTVRSDSYVPRPTVVNSSDYGDRLMLLPGGLAGLPCCKGWMGRIDGMGWDGMA